MRFRAQHPLGFAVLCAALLTGHAAGAQRALVDDFSGATIDFGAWSSTVNLREIVDGRLVLEAGSPANTGSRTRLRTRSTALSSLAATVTVESAAIEPGSWSMVRLEGIYYNVQSASPPDFTGDIWAAIFIGERGDGLEAWWEVWESLNGGFTDDVMRDGGTLVAPGTLTLGTAYPASIDYDGNNQFTFTLGADVAVGTGPARMGGPSSGYQEFSTRVYAGGSVHATIDDATADGVMSDDFAAPMIDADKWHHVETARVVENDALRLEVRGVDLQPSDSSRVLEALTLADNPDYIEAQLSVSNASVLDPGLIGQTGIVGVFYNRERDGGTLALPYDGMAGDVWGRVELQLRGDDLIGSARMEYAADAGNTVSTELFRRDFVTPLALGRDYLLWVRRKGERMTFGIDDETIEYDIVTAIFDPSPDNGGGNRAVVAAIEGSATSDPAGASGLLKASVDDVYVGAPEAGDSAWLTATHPLVVLQLIAIVLLRRRLLTA